MIETIRKNYAKLGFTEKEVEEAALARKVQARISNPPDKVYKQIVSAEGNHGLRNCPVEPHHINDASPMFGPNLTGLKGRAVGKKVRFAKTMGGD